MTPTEHKFEPNLASPNKTNRANNDTEAAGGSQIGSDGNSQYETASLSQSGTTQSVSESVVADQPKVEPKFFKVYNHEYENTDPKQYAVTNSAAVEFIEVIRQEQKKGYGFLPWIGAGLSAPSGIPLVAEIKAYLERCIALALGVEGDNSSPWNPRTDAWPPYHDARRVHDKTSYFKVKTEFEIRREKGTWDPELAIFWEAIGAMAEWRTALLFLSRLKREKQGLGMEWPMILALDAPNPEVIDAGLRAIIGHKNPSLGHRMMAALAGLLRLDILITTNFDNLLEAAFERSRNPLTTSPLELVNHFPSAASLAGRRTLIKIHGGERSLRADYSLDAPPTEEDCWRFLQYLTTPDSRRKMLKELSSGITPGSLDFRSHLLITGFSAGEKRTRTFIGHAWKYLRNL